MGGCLSRSSLMEFLIVLKTSDYEAACPLTSSYSTKVKRSEDDLPGILHVISITNINNMDDSESRPKFITQDIVIPRTLYVKLPKENIFVKWAMVKWNEVYFFWRNLCRVKVR